MGASLSSLFISQSYQSLIHLGTDTTITTFTSTPAELQDGFGNGSGVLLNNAGNIIASGSLTVVNDISSSTLNGVGNVTLYSASVASRLSQLEFDSASQDQRLDSLEAFTGSEEQRLSSLESFTASANISISNINTFTASASSRLVNLELKTGSYATTGSGTFNGNQTFSGSIRGVVIPLSIASQTASMDLSLGNFFTLTLTATGSTFLNPSNIQPGQTTQLLITQTSSGSLLYPVNILFPTGSDYSASIGANKKDILSFASFDTASLYAVSVKTLV